jgi:hypothetical protein
MMIGSIGHDFIDVGDAIGSPTVGFQRSHTNVFESCAVAMGLNLSLLFCEFISWCKRDPLQKFKRSICTLHGETCGTTGQEMRQKVSLRRIGAIDRVCRNATIDTGLTEKVLRKRNHKEESSLIGVLLKGSPSVLYGGGGRRVTS